MNLGTAYTHILEFLAANQPLPLEVEKARKKLEVRADKLSKQQAARKRSTLCPCTQHQKSGGLLICNECWRAASPGMRVAFTNATTTDGLRVAGRALLGFAESRRPAEAIA